MTFPGRISVAVPLSILPVAIKVKHEPEIVWAGRTVAVRRKHERIDHIFVIFAERVGRCTRTQWYSIAYGDFVHSRVEDGPTNACKARQKAWLGPRSQSVSTRLGHEWSIHQLCCGMGGKAIGLPAAKLIISVLARAGRACCWNRNRRASVKGRQCKWRRRILGCEIGFVHCLCFV